MPESESPIRIDATGHSSAGSRPLVIDQVNDAITET